MTIWKLPETQKQLKPNRPDSRLRGNDGSFITFEYCRYPKVWIPACAGMTIWKLPETQKQLKPNRPDSRLRGNDGSFITFEYCHCPMVWIPACAGMTDAV